MTKLLTQRPIVITTCSASKRYPNSIGINQLPRGTQKSTANAWLKTIARESQLIPARQLYAGRAFRLALRSAETIQADLGVISAGLGYIQADTLIPSYDLTVQAGGLGSVVKHIQGNFDAKNWWRSMAGSTFTVDIVSDLVNRPLVLMCLSRPYAKMIEDDLLAILKTEPTNLRIFGLSIGKVLPKALQDYILPYDERLNRLGLDGTRFDFSQRALLDYVEHLAPHEGSLAFDRSTVEHRMAKGPQPYTPERYPQRVDDSTIRKLIANLIPSLGLNRTRLLAHIRQEQGFSCEQQRFSRLYSEVTGI